MHIGLRFVRWHGTSSKLLQFLLHVQHGKLVQFGHGGSLFQAGIDIPDQRELQRANRDILKHVLVRIRHQLVQTFDIKREIDGTLYTEYVKVSHLKIYPIRTSTDGRSLLEHLLFSVGHRTLGSPLA